ncbi:MAG TPA: hemerythrin domain-containing protein [Steroidobacteraceae bacterium]|nr:hemerythrin domain-containing protein [Steroidobacteraceae bacterium]
MSSRKSRSGSRGSNRARSTRAGAKSAARRSDHTGSLSAKRRGASNSERGRRGRRAAGSASSAVKLLKQDHRAVAQALEQFESAEHEEKQSIAQRICRMLTVHAQIEEELLYPAARDALSPKDAHLVAEARVEHASLKELIGQIEGRGQMDEEYEAKVCVLGEYVKHHVSEEEKELFPRLERSSLDLEGLGERLEERKSELMGEQGMGESSDTMSESGVPPWTTRGATRRGQRSAGLHARRR